MVLAQGALSYGLTSIMGAVVLEIFQGKHYGSIFGTVMLAALAGGATGPWITVLHDLQELYDHFAAGIAVSGLSAGQSGWHPAKSGRSRPLHRIKPSLHASTGRYTACRHRQPVG